MSELFLYLTTTGRVTGKAHQIEIWFVEHEDAYYICAEQREQSDWVRNIMKDKRVSFYVAERGQEVASQEGHATIVEDEAVLAILHQKFDAKYNWSDGLFVGVSG